ncbi:MAG TPA: tetratricopeptide repeat protein [Candidatus Limnocylindrales bacterium]|nr:tetratricopeptide repeat protein [Candidatus Limnocylindrales bacterium]
MKVSISCGRAGALAVACLALGVSACAVPKALQTPIERSTYRDILERQAEGVAVEEETLKKLPPMTAADYERLGDTYLMQNKLGLANVKYVKALELDPTAWKVRYKLGVLLLKQNVPQQALLYFNEIVTMDSMNARGHEGRGRALLAMGQHEEAEKALRTALDLDSGLWKAHETLGVLCDALGRFPEAIEAYQTALKIQPNEPSVLNNLGVAYYLSKDYGRAISTFERALTVTPAGERARVYNNLGRAYAKTGSYPRAYEAFRKGADPAKAYNNLGLIYLEDGRTKQAASCFQKAIHASPTYYAEATENLRAVQAGLSSPEDGPLRVAAACP